MYCGWLPIKKRSNLFVCLLSCILWSYILFIFLCFTQVLTHWNLFSCQIWISDQELFMMYNMRSYYYYYIGWIDADHGRADEQDYHELTRCDWIMNAAAARVSGESGHQMIGVIAGVLWSPLMLLSDFIVAPLKSLGSRSQRWRSNRLPHASCIPSLDAGRAPFSLQHVCCFLPSCKMSRTPTEFG